MAHSDVHPPCCSTHLAFVCRCAADTAVEGGYLAGRVDRHWRRCWRLSPGGAPSRALCVPDGARLLLVDFWTDPTHTQPLLTALMAGELLIHSGGHVYREAEARRWLTASGRR